MLSVEIDLDEKSFEGGGVVILKADFPTNGAALSRTKKTGSKALLKKIIN